MIGSYTPLSMLHAYRSRKEQFSNTNEITGMAYSVFLVAFLLSLIIWAWTLWSLIQYWPTLPLFAQFIAILGLVTPLGPVISLIAIYGFKH